jgi:hypothetical protein
LIRLPEIWLTEIARLLPELLDERPSLRRPEQTAEPSQRQRWLVSFAVAVDGATTTSEVSRWMARL